MKPFYSINKKDLKDDVFFEGLMSYDSEWLKIFVFFILALIICSLLLLIAYFLSLKTIKDSEKLGEYECGFEPFDNATRHPFDVHFYIVGILFLIFDVEIALLFPWIIALNVISLYGFYIMQIFLILLTIGFFYEWHKGALVWPHKTLILTISPSQTH